MTIVSTLMPARRGVELVAATAGRTVEDWAAYQEFRRAHPGICTFCAASETSDDHVVAVLGSMLVLRNRWPYAAWDSRVVTDHLMIVPVRHLLALSEFTEAEVRDWFTLARDYEALGYSTYTRAPGNASRSVAHLHTHLIRTEGRFEA